jgi:hypothetical protein
MKSRLLAVQGPLQFIAGLLAMEWYKKIKDSSEESKSVLLMYDFLAPETIEPELFEIITRMASVRVWHSVVFISSKDMGSIMKGSYSSSIRRLCDTIGEYDFDEIYLARDFCGHGSPLIINAYRNAKKIIYGDSLGVVGNEAGINSFNWHSPATSLLSVCKRLLRERLYGAPDRLQFNAAVLTLPIVCSNGYLDDVPLFIPRIDFVVSTIQSVYQKLSNLSDYCDSLIRLAGESNCLLFLLSNLNRSGLMTKEKEIALYVEIINETAVKGSSIFLKAHPRDSGEVLDAIVDRLHANFKIIAIDDARVSRIPIELWAGLIESCRVIPIFSSSAITLKYIYRKSVWLPLNEELVRRYFFKDKISYILESNHWISKSIENLEIWDGRSLLFESTL